MTPSTTSLECRARDLTFSRPLYVDVELHIKETGEQLQQRVYMGDFPSMTERGTFIINGAERVVVSQLVRSPGVYYTATEDANTGRQLFSAKVIPNRGAWLEFETAAKTPLRQGRSQAQARSHQAASGRGLRDQREIVDLFKRVDTGEISFISETLGARYDDDPDGSAHRGLQEAATRRSANR